MTELAQTRTNVPARIALLALRGTLKHGGLTEPVTYRLNSSRTLLDAEAAFRVLTEAPKPLDLDATVRGGVLEVSYRTLTEPKELAAHEWIRGGADQYGGPLGFLRQRYGNEIDHLPVLCVGATERLRVTVSDVVAFDRDYRASPRTGYGAAFADSAYAQNECGVQPAEAQEFCAVVGFQPTRGNFGIAFALPRWIARLFARPWAS